MRAGSLRGLFATAFLAWVAAASWHGMAASWHGNHVGPRAMSSAPGAVPSRQDATNAGEGAAAGGAPRAPEQLEDTGLYEPGRFGVIAAANRAFSPQYPLWSDGAAKSRWVYIPPGAMIDTTDLDAWNFPVGTRFWKEFTFEGRKVETRMLWKADDRDWVFASYVWNEAQTSATLAPDRGVRGVAEVAHGTRHSIPSVDECRACHVSARTEVLGFNTLQLSDDRDPLAPHAEPLMPGMVTLKTLVHEGLLTPDRQDLVLNPPRIAVHDPKTRAVLGYFSTNCGACHNAKSAIQAARMLLKQSSLASAPRADHVDEDERLADAGNPALATIVNHPGTWTPPALRGQTPTLVMPGVPEQSTLFLRMKSRRPSSQMPPLGTVLADREAIELVTSWIREMRGTEDAGVSLQNRAVLSPER